MKQRLENTALVKDHIVRNSDLMGRDRNGQTDGLLSCEEKKKRLIRPPLPAYLPPVVVIALWSGRTNAGSKPEAAAGV